MDKKVDHLIVDRHDTPLASHHTLHVHHHHHAHHVQHVHRYKPLFPMLLLKNLSSRLKHLAIYIGDPPPVN